jgi:galactose mutarotase-like enzyme
MAEVSVVGVTEENVLIQAGGCSVNIYPRLGGKIASIRVRDQELMQAPLTAYAPRTQTMTFDEGDASGWDECLPSVAGCTVETASGPALIPDHGDLWRVAWQTIAASGHSATFCGECFSVPLRLERTTTLTETDAGKAWRLQVDYKVTNTGSHPTPWSWAVHPMYAVEPGDRIVLPSSITSLILEGSGGGRLGQQGGDISWPLAKLVKGGETDLSAVQWPESGVGDKLFAGPLAASENWCALERYKAGVRIKVSFDPAATPYLGLWICSGGWPDRPGKKQLCVGMEPTTAPVDSLARTGLWSRTLAAGESFSWPMIVEFESI